MRLKLLLTAAAITLLIAGPGCGASPPSQGQDRYLLSLAERVDASRMLETVDYLASEELRGRPAGSPQSAGLEAGLAEDFARLGLQPVDQFALGGFRQEFQVPAERCFLETPSAPDAVVTCANILGKIAGESGTEMVILTANYDGMGVDAATGAVYPGADYNASGASAVLELAAVFSSLDIKPGKTIVFALLGAEECGGYGSRALAESLEAGGFRSSVRIINLEGLGGGEGDYMDIWDLNYRKNRPTVEAVDEAASLLGVELELGGADPGTAAGTFFLYHLPAVTCDWSWFERGEHPDFHLPTDTPDRLNREGMGKVTRVVAVATWLLAR